MKTLSYRKIAAAFTSSSVRAETPEQISTDYRRKAAATLVKVNDTLEKAVVPIL